MLLYKEKTYSILDHPLLEKKPGFKGFISPGEQDKIRKISAIGPYGQAWIVVVVGVMLVGRDMRLGEVVMVDKFEHMFYR